MKSTNDITPISHIEPSKNNKECLDISIKIISPKNKIEKYSLHLAQVYFKNNISSFSKEEFISITKNKAF